MCDKTNNNDVNFEQTNDTNNENLEQVKKDCANSDLSNESDKTGEPLQPPRPDKQPPLPDKISWFNHISFWVLFFVALALLLAFLWILSTLCKYAASAKFSLFSANSDFIGSVIRYCLLTLPFCVAIVVIFYSQIVFVLYKYNRNNIWRDIWNFVRAIWFYAIRATLSIAFTIGNIFTKLGRKNGTYGSVNDLINDIVYKCPKNIPKKFKELYDNDKDNDFRQMYNWLFCRPKGGLNNIQSHNIGMLFLRYFAALTIIFCISNTVLCSVKNSTPVASAPETSTPVTSTPVTSTPVASAPETSTPETSTPETSTPETSTPVASAPVASAQEKKAQKDPSFLIAYLIMGNIHENNDVVKNYHWGWYFAVFIAIMVVGALFMAAITKKFVDEKPTLIFAPKIFYNRHKRAFTVLCQNQDCASLTDIKYFLGISLIFNKNDKREAFFGKNTDKNMCLFLAALNRNALSIDSMITIHMETLPLPPFQKKDNTDDNVNKDIDKLRKLLEKDFYNLQENNVSQIDDLNIDDVKSNVEKVFVILKDNPQSIPFYFKDLEKLVDSTIKTALSNGLTPNLDTYKRLLKSIQKEDSGVDYSYEELKANGDLLTCGHKRQFIQLYPTLRIKTSKDQDETSKNQEETSKTQDEDEFLFAEPTCSDPTDKSGKRPDIDKLIRVIVHARSVTTGTEFIWQKDYKMSDVICGCANVKDFRDWYDSDLIDMYNGNFDNIILRVESDGYKHCVNDKGEGVTDSVADPCSGCKFIESCPLRARQICSESVK